MRVAIYARFSSDMQSRASAENQIRECTSYAVRQGWTVVAVERDEAVRAGEIASREGYARVVKAAQAGTFDILLVEEVSHFSRDFLGSMQELGALAKLKVKIADTRNGIIDLDSARGQMLGAVNLTMAHAEAKKIGERLKRGLKGKVLANFSSGGRPAYGHKRVAVFSETETDVDGRPKRIGVRLEPDERTAPIVKRIFRMFDDGCAMNEIARTLNEDKIPSRDAGEVRQGAKNSGTWAHHAVKGILENELYVGERIWNKHSRTGEKLRSGKKAMRPNPESEWVRVKDYAPAIIERPQWNRVQAKLAKSKAEFEKQGNANNHRQYMLSGFIKCGTCGASYVIGGHFKGQRQYRCSFRVTRGKAACSNTVVVPQDALEVRVRHVLDVMAKDPVKLEALVAEHNKRVRSLNDEQTSTIRHMEDRLGAVNTAMANIVSAIEQGAGSLDALIVSVKDRDAEAKALKAAIASAQAQVLPLLLPRPLAVADYLRGAASVFTGDYVADRAFLDGVLEQIAIHPDGTIILRFRADSLFAPLGKYEMRPSPTPVTKPAVGPDVAVGGAAFEAKTFDGGDLLAARLARLQANAALSTIRAIAAPDAGDFEQRAIDFGGGVVATYHYPLRKIAVASPEGQARHFATAAETFQGLPRSSCATPELSGSRPTASA